MAISVCNTTVDSTQRELVEHGTVAFPIACYHDDLGENEVPWHWHEELEAVVISEGCCTVAAGSQRYTVRQGEGFFVNAGILHGCWDLDRSGCRFHSLVFHPRLVGGSMDSVFWQRYVSPLTENHDLESIHLTPEVPWQRSALAAIESAWQLGVRESNGHELRVRNALSELVLLLHENVPDDRKRVSTRAVREEERIKRMLQYIHDHHKEEIRIQDIAGAAAVSESECLRCFRGTIGTTPIQYVRQYRIQRAAQLLTETDLPVCAVAEACGFQDVSYFSKTFRSLRGCAPSVYRSGRTKP